MYNPRALAGTLAAVAGREALRGLRTQVLNPIVRQGIQGTFNRRKQYTIRGGFPKSTMRGRRSYLRRRRGRRSRRTSRRRTFRRRNTGRVGFNVGTGLTRICKVVDQPFGSRNYRDLLIHNLSNIPIGDNTKIHTRDRATINLRGWRINFMVELLDNITREAVVNWAVLVPKAADAPETDDFFRSFGEPTSTKRSSNFSTTLTGREMCYGKINTDMYYIIKHKRFTLTSPVGTNQDEQYGANHKRIDTWIPFNRQLRFDDSQPTITCTTPVYFVMWVDMPSNNTNAVVQTWIRTAMLHTAIFRNSGD